MITCKEIKDKYYVMLMHDCELKEIVQDVTEKLYDEVIKRNNYTIIVRYEIEKAKKIAFCLRTLGYHVEEYKHGKLHVTVM